MKKLSTICFFKLLSAMMAAVVFCHDSISANQSSVPPMKVEYSVAGAKAPGMSELPLISKTSSANAHIFTFRDRSYQVVIHEIDRNYYTEVNGEVQSLSETGSCLTLRVIFPVTGEKWIWFSGLDKSFDMRPESVYTDTVSVRTTVPPAGAFNGKDLSEGGYGDAVGAGTMSYYPLCALSTERTGSALGVDITIPVVYRLSGEKDKGLIAEFDLAATPLTRKFPNRAFFKLSRFDFDSEWGMRAALKIYYNIYNEAFKKRVINEGIWLPFTAMRSIPGWEDFGFAFHETSWGSSDLKDGVKIPNIVSDRGTGVLSFQYTEPWDVQIPIKSKTIPYDSVVSEGVLPERHMAYLGVSATKDKNGLWQTRRLETPWFRTGWAVSITTNCDPELPGFNRYGFVRRGEIDPALKLNVDGIYFDSMEWNWHHDLNYNEDHFSFSDYPLTFSASTGRPAIWNLTSEFEFMKKISDEMHSQGKLAMGNGHGWNPFVASNLDLFGAELSWYSTGDHNVTALDFKRIISFQKPIVFLLNEGLNDIAFTEAPYPGYEIYFEKMMAYGFFPSFFSVDASNDPYWQDKNKIENGRPFFKKYIPLIKEISAAGWEPVTAARTKTENVRIERFGEGERIYFTIRNNGADDARCDISLDLDELKINGRFTAFEIVIGEKVKVGSNQFTVYIPAGRTRALRIEAE